VTTRVLAVAAGWLAPVQCFNNLEGINAAYSYTVGVVCFALWEVPTIPFVNSVKYLCMIFNRRIIWILHIEMIGAKAFRSFIGVYSLFRSE
jgi:hypothetical protein